ncbi:hypothetical protein HGRIS_004696 [Hohenbuehelia grisea]|uniref:Uncharacterized protein n=1 Tax=Hohenbuehelia grisea TaxID=104357 RepID=A0ABR3JCM6_9AGAR
MTTEPLPFPYAACKEFSQCQAQRISSRQPQYNSHLGYMVITDQEETTAKIQRKKLSRLSKQYDVLLVLGTVIMTLLFSGVSLMRDALSDGADSSEGATLTGPNSIYSLVYLLSYLGLGCVTVSCAVAFGGALVTSYLLQQESISGLIIPNHQARVMLCVAGLIAGPSLLVIALGVVFMPYLTTFEVALIVILFVVGHVIEVTDLGVTMKYASEIRKSREKPERPPKPQARKDNETKVARLIRESTTFMGWFAVLPHVPEEEIDLAPQERQVTIQCYCPCTHPNSSSR